MDHDSEILSAIIPLRRAGLALHWLHPRSKRPIGDAWQDAPVATLEELRRTHARGNNLGVRLGEPSVVAGYYAHVLDFDIRHADLAEEAWDKFHEILPDVDPNDLPCVASGSGGESRHLYFLSDKPFFSKKLAVSEGKHRRWDADRKKDVWSCDWEIDLFGTGKQVVLPPSIHPDTKKPYLWVREFDFDMLDLGFVPFISSEVIEALGVAHAETYAFESREPLTFKEGQMERELDLIPVSDLHYDDWIVLGQAIHHQLGGSDEGFQLWLQHTRRSAKYDGDDRTMLRKWRSFGKNRRAPVTMATVRQWAIDQRAAAYRDAFDEEDEEPEGVTNNDTPAVDPFEDIFGDTPAPAADPFDDGLDDAATPAKPSLDWTSLLHFNEEGAVKPTLHNLRLIVENDHWTRKVPAFNEFIQEIVQRGIPGKKPGRRKNQAKETLQLTGSSWELRDPVNGDFWTEDKDNAIRALLEAPETQGGYGIKVADRDLRAAVDIAGRENCFHPVREYLAGLTWDGISRVETLFIDYLGAPDDAYHRHVARIMLVAAVTRVHEPGHKFDTAVILEGLQGKRKSTFISTLAKGWFVELDGDFTDAKSMVELMQGAWIIELAELGSFAKADVRHIKSFISRQSDKVRLAYAKRAQVYHRQSILIGSTNDDVYLKDASGGRRFLPVRCLAEQIDTERLALEIDQIWAEAITLYRQMRVEKPRGTLPLYLVDSEARETAERLQESRKVESTEDGLTGRIEEWLNKPINEGGFETGSDEIRQEVCLLQIWCDCLGRDEGQYVGGWPMTLGRAMRAVPGWIETSKRPRFGKFGQQRAFERIDRKDPFEE